MPNGVLHSLHCESSLKRGSFRLQNVNKMVQIKILNSQHIQYIETCWKVYKPQSRNK